ncbi:MAG: ABC transporter substrate-binding protein, partial [Planctomycetota bacterium]
ALPLVHLVLPNHARPLTASPSFRRALLMGLDRAAMLEQLMQGASLAGYEVVSGPLPVGVEAGDPLRAFSDPAISPRACDPELAALLAESARCEVLAAGTLGAAADPESPIHVVLAHPAHELTKTIAEMLARQWRLIGIEVELRPVVDPAMVPEQVDADLFLVEAAPWEPAFDLPRLLGEEGLTGGCTPYMSELLRQLLRAGSSADLQARCRAIHRLVNAETSVLPLWQWVEHYAYRSDLSGVVRPVSSVYEGVEGWRLSFVWNAGGETMP